MADTTTGQEAQAAATESCDGASLIGALEYGYHLLAANKEEINRLNVFPVPDGDTGTNMLLTLEAALQAGKQADGGHAGEVAQAVYRGALMGARGNSGVIFSQCLRGIADALAGAAELTAAGLTRALRSASDSAYAALQEPQEGTMLTVARETAEACEELAPDAEIGAVLATAVAAAARSVARTPQLLDVLRDAGVVDAGGQGLWLFLEGARRYAAGEPVEEVALPTGERALLPEIAAVTETLYGYCTGFLVSGAELDVMAMRDAVAARGDSVVVVGDEDLVRVHVHTENPGDVLALARGAGHLHRIEIFNMDDQHELMQSAAADGDLPGVEVAPALRQAQGERGVRGEGVALGERGGQGEGSALGEQSEQRVVAVADGAGLREVYEGMGAAVVSGGPTMNPSTQEIHRAVEAANARHVFVLPNDKNVILSAEQARELTDTAVHVLPTYSMAQGIAALFAFQADVDPDENAAAMREAAESTQYGAVTLATRDATVDGVAVAQGQWLALANNRVCAANDNLEAALLAVIEGMKPETAELLTCYYGAAVTAAGADAVADGLRAHFPALEVELIAGGQPHYPYLLTLE